MSANGTNGNEVTPTHKQLNSKLTRPSYGLPFFWPAGHAHFEEVEESYGQLFYGY